MASSLCAGPCPSCPSRTSNLAPSKLDRSKVTGGHGLTTSTSEFCLWLSSRVSAKLDTRTLHICAEA
eukprot:1765511-Pyramimonas_sp.AAC.3